MQLEIRMTWPACRPIPISFGHIDCSQVKVISHSKATKTGDRITIDHAFGISNRVSDDDRYRITWDSPSPLDCCPPCGPRERFERTLVIVMESPHRDEYRNDCIDLPIGPAQGKTGHNIRDHLMSVLHSCQGVHNYLDQQTRVILANPIQFQTSLAAMIQPPGGSMRFRNATWGKIWKLTEIQDEFKFRLRSYRPDVVVNACTDKLKERIGIFLDQNFPCVQVYEAKHPAAWNKQGNRSLLLARPILAGSSQLTIANLDGATLTLTLPEGTTFAADVCESHFELVTDIPRVRVRTVSNVSSGDTTVRLTLGSISTRAVPGTLAVMVRKRALSPSRARTSNVLCVGP